ncbi:MAG: triose-phosphate isomerase [Bacteroidales bacterium]|nr:triose-phosphate isomerase [Bacteroidales bacterium]
MRKKIVAGNWKMNTTVQEGIKLAKAVSDMVSKLDNSNAKVAIAPPFTHLSEIAKVINPDYICLAAQNCASEEGGAYTGEVAPAMLAELGVMAVLVGHSERRAYYKEDHNTLAKKVKLVLKNDMKPIFCCGEVLEERENNIQNEIVSKQLEESLFHLSSDEILNCIIAYEPVWAIGTGKTATAMQAQEIHAYIRSLLINKYGAEIANEITILYGGSCKPSNAPELFSNSDVDGGLIGGAALKSEDFLGIIKAF